MKTILGVTLVALAIGGGLAFSQAQDQKDKDSPKDDSAKKMAVLENDLISTRTRCEALATDLSETKATLARVVHYLDAQALSAGTLAGILDESEKAGFTAGINPSSREILLAGWREHLTAMQRDVPVLPAPPAPAPAPSKKPGSKSDATDTPK